MTQLMLRDICFSLGDILLLDHASLQVQPGEHICLLGRNGTGKSTIMKIIQGQVKADSGDLEYQQGLRLAYLQQEVPVADDRSVSQVILAGLGENAKIMLQYEALSKVEHLSDKQMDELHELQEQIERHQLWGVYTQVEKVLSKLELSGEAIFSELSGGLKRRVLLGQALVNDPDILLLDEPTNHLDMQSIEWLQNFLKTYPKTLIFVSHDRQFLQAVATRIIELDRGQLTSWPGNYENYLRRKEEALAAEETANALFDKKLAQEEVWIRQGIKARRTRNEGRVRALESLRRQRAERRVQSGKADFNLQHQQASGRLVIEATHLNYEIGGRKIIDDFSCNIMRGDKIGIIGPNGCGKTTLINLLLNPPADAPIRHGTQLQIAYFDQLRDQLQPDKSVVENLAEGRSHVEINGQLQHVVGYLQNFLFTPRQTQAPVKSLSGGERNRLLLAKLFAKPANFLVLDEPTNDLDIETLELLESLLVDFSGTLLIVSHDREFLNNVVSSTFVFEGKAKISEYVGGYDDWLHQRASIDFSNKESDKKVTLTKEDKKSVKLSYKDQRELEALPKKIELLEAEKLQIEQRLTEASFYQQPADEIKVVTDRLEAINQELVTAYQRWEALE